MTLGAPSKYGIDDEGELETRDLPCGLDRPVGVASSAPSLNLWGHDLFPFSREHSPATLPSQSHAVNERWSDGSQGLRAKHVKGAPALYEARSTKLMLGIKTTGRSN